MVEVEKKFNPTQAQLATLLEGAELESQVKVKDQYYDTPAWDLVRSDTYLRQRDGKWELKIGKNLEERKTNAAVTAYDELETEEEIRAALSLPTDGTMEEVVKAAGYDPFVTFVTNRGTYTKEGFTIVTDDMDFGYFLIEIETLVESDDQIGEAGEKIVAFAKRHGLSAERVRGKLVAWAEENDPELFQILVDQYGYNPPR